MGLFLSITNASREQTPTSKFYSFTTDENNEIIIDPSDFPGFVRTFRSLQNKKEDNQIELHHVVLQWKSHLRLGQETQEIRNKAYELIEIIEGLHDEQDAILESEKYKLDTLVKEKTLKDSREHLGAQMQDSRGHVGTRMQDSREHLGAQMQDSREHLGAQMQDSRGHSGTRMQDSRGHSGTHGDLVDELEFDEMRKEISTRQQYLRIFNAQCTSTLKLALIDIELCQKMVDYSKDFKADESEEEDGATYSEDEIKTIGQSV